MADAVESTDVKEVGRRMIQRIIRFGTVDGFSDEQIFAIIQKSKEQLEKLPAMIVLRSPVIVFGDIHGQLADLLRFFKIIGQPPKFQFLFLGDYVDRGKKSLEVIILLLCMKLQYPKKVHLLRGNHEIAKVNRIYGFYQELRRKRKAGSALWSAFQEMFVELPLCAVVQSKILCMHGGISEALTDWNRLREMKKPKKASEHDTGLAIDLMWSDPSTDPCTTPFAYNTVRGISVLFNEEAVTKTCDALEVDLIVRAHEVKSAGHEFRFNNHLLTIFTAPNYMGNESNSGSVLKISKSLKVCVMTLKPKYPAHQLNSERAKLIAEMNAKNPRTPDPCCQRSKHKRSETDVLHIPFESMFTPSAHVVVQQDERGKRVSNRNPNEVISMEQVKDLLTEAASKASQVPLDKAGEAQILPTSVANAQKAGESPQLKAPTTTPNVSVRSSSSHAANLDPKAKEAAEEHKKPEQVEK